MATANDITRVFHLIEYTNSLRVKMPYAYPHVPEYREAMDEIRNTALCPNCGGTIPDYAHLFHSHRVCNCASIGPRDNQYPINCEAWYALMRACDGLPAGRWEGIRKAAIGYAAFCLEEYARTLIKESELR